MQRVLVGLSSVVILTVVSGCAGGGLGNNDGGIINNDGGIIDATPALAEAGTCTSGYHDDGEGACVASGCAQGYHAGGEGGCFEVGTCSCLASGCSPGYHDSGAGLCVATGCTLGYYAADLDTCAACEDVHHCGADCQACPTDPQGTPACAGNTEAAWFACSLSCAQGYWLNGTSCAACNEVAHCGSDCLACSDTTPDCVSYEGTYRCGCTTNSECGVHKYCAPDHTCLDEKHGCEGMEETCGASGDGDCCESPLVTGGTFYRGYDGTANYDDTSYPATVSDFRLDKYEITVGRFRNFVDAGYGTQASPPVAGSGAHLQIVGSGWDDSWNANLASDTAGLKTAVQCGGATWTDNAGANENLPMNCITWWEAFAYCAWDGGFLATEAEWNYAAAGGSEQRYYPWSNPPSSPVIDGTYAVYNGVPIANVGSDSPQGDGLYGQADLAGNVTEWVLDGNGGGTYPVDCDNCADLTDVSSRVIRGGAMCSSDGSLRDAYRDGVVPPTLRDASVGARCARTP